MYLHHIIGFSKLVINKIAYGGANFIPIAVPRKCLKFFLTNSKMLFFRTISASSMRVSLEICLLSLNSKILRIEVRPSLCGMLV